MPQKKIQKHNHLQSFAPVDDELIEIIDEHSKPFMIMPRKDALMQNLRCKAVLVVLRNRENNIYIHRRALIKHKYAGLWNVSAAGFVQAGEAVKDAAIRELEEELGVSSVPLGHIATLEPSFDTDWTRVSLFLSSPVNALIHTNQDEISEGMFVDKDEVMALVRDMPEALTPALKWAVQFEELFKI